MLTHGLLSLNVSEHCITCRFIFCILVLACLWILGEPVWSKLNKLAGKVDCCEM